jgi:hypothetical protein
MHLAMQASSLLTFSTNFFDQISSRNVARFDATVFSAISCLLVTKSFMKFQSIQFAISGVEERGVHKQPVDWQGSDCPSIDISLKLNSAHRPAGQIDFVFLLSKPQKIAKSIDLVAGTENFAIV